MNSVPQLLARFQERGITLFLFDGALKFKAPPGAMAQSDRDELTRAKPDIVNYFLAQKAAAFPPLEAAARPHAPAHIQVAWWAWVRHSPVQLPHERLGFVIEVPHASPAHIQTVLRDVITRHGTLSTRFFEREGQLALDYNSPSAFFIESETSPAASTDEAWARAREFTGRKLAVESEWLLRAKAISLPSGETLLALVVHHILADGYTIELLHAELEAILLDQPAALPVETDIHFTDYAALERKWFETAGPALIAYWKNWLAQQAPLKLGTRVLQWENAGRNTNNDFLLGAPAVRRMEELGQQLNTSAFIVYLTVFAISLARWSGQKQFPVRCIGNLRGTHAPFAVIGNLVCADPVSVDIPESFEFPALVRSVAREYYNAITLRLPSLLNFPAHPAYPELAQEKFTNTIAATMNFAPGKAYASTGTAPRQSGEGVETMEWPPKVERTPPQDWPALLWPINFRLSEMGGQIAGLFQFNEDIIAPGQQDRLMAIFFDELAAVMRRP